MHRNLPDFVMENHNKSTFLKEKDMLTTQDVVDEAH